MHKQRQVTLLALLLIIAAPVLAQIPPPPLGHHRGGPRDSGGPGMERGFENLRLLKLLEAVDLSEAQSEKFVPLFHAFRRDMRQLKHQRRDLVRALRNLTADEASENELGEAIGKLRENQAAATSRQEKFLDQCTKMLTPRQMARLVVFQEEFEQKVLESLREFRNRPAPTPESETKDQPYKGR